jgi:hypothetical protein
MKRILSVVVRNGLPPLAFAGADKVEFRGGTLPLKNGTELTVDLADPAAAFVASKELSVRIPWTGVKTIELRPDRFPPVDCRDPAVTDRALLEGAEALRERGTDG